MKVNELMVGDWVKVNGINLKVGAIHADEVGVYDSDCKIYWCSNDGLDRIDPIPLTKDILVKNGFSYTANVIGRHNCKCYELEQKGVYHMTISIYKNEITCELDKVDAMYMNVVTNCVHQLQHLMRLCGIEKELVIDEL
jgi:hypothetical protein